MKSPMYLYGLVLHTRKGDEPWVKKIADGVKLFIAVRFRAGSGELKDISKSFNKLTQMKVNRG